MKKILSIFSVSFALVFSSSAFANTIGVVYDSDEEYEFNETLNKAQALFSAARDVFSEKSKKWLF